MNKETIIQTALDNLDPALLRGEWQPYTHVNSKPDGKLTLFYEGQKVMFEVILKKELRTYQVDQIIIQAANIHNFMVVAYRLFPALKEKLKKHHINYIEANGNLYVNADNVLLFLDYDKKLKMPDQTGNRAFTPTGLKVMFELLRNQDLINDTQRTIAKKTSVALGNIPKVIKGLQQAGYLYKLNKNEYAFHDKKDLLQTWAEVYHTTLQPTLDMGTFKIQGRGTNWNELNLNEQKTVWGGEPAADLITNYLRPEILTIYTEETKKELMLNYGLVPDKNGNVRVFEKFWQNDQKAASAPDMLIYADLINTQDNRCIETAMLIFNERIEPNL